MLVRENGREKGTQEGAFTARRRQYDCNRDVFSAPTWGENCVVGKENERNEGAAATKMSLFSIDRLLIHRAIAVCRARLFWVALF